MCLWFFENHPMGSCFGSTETQARVDTQISAGGPSSAVLGHRLELPSFLPSFLHPQNTWRLWGPAVKNFGGCHSTIYNILLLMRNVEQFIL